MNNLTIRALLILALLFISQISPSIGHATFTFEKAWTDSDTQTDFYLNDVPESQVYYYFPKYQVIPYTGGSHDYYNKTAHRSFPGFSRYYKYTFHIFKTLDLDVFRRAQTALGPESRFLEAPISHFEHIGSSLDHLPYASITISPCSGKGPAFQEQFYVTFSVWKDDVSRFESFLTNGIGIPLEFNLSMPGAQITFDGFIQFNAKNLFKSLSEEIAKLGRVPTEEDVRNILLQLKNTAPETWTIYQRKNPNFADRSNEVEVIFLKAADILKNYYFNINEKGELIYKRESDLGQSIALQLSDSFVTEFKDVPFQFSLKLPAGASHEVPPSQNQ